MRGVRMTVAMKVTPDLQCLMVEIMGLIQLAPTQMDFPQHVKAVCNQRVVLSQLRFSDLKRLFGHAFCVMVFVQVMQQMGQPIQRTGGVNMVVTKYLSSDHQRPAQKLIGRFEVTQFMQQVCIVIQCLRGQWVVFTQNFLSHMQCTVVQLAGIAKLPHFVVRDSEV